MKQQNRKKMKKINIALILVALAAQLSSNVYAVKGENGEATFGVLTPATSDSIQFVESRNDEVAKNKALRNQKLEVLGSVNISSVAK